MHFLVLIAIEIAISIIAALLTRPKAPGINTASPPVTSPGTPIPVLFGRAKIGGNVIWFGGYKGHPITQYAFFGLEKTQIGRNFSISMAVALCVGPIDTWYDIIADTGQRFTEFPASLIVTAFAGSAFLGFTAATVLNQAITLDHGFMPFDVVADEAGGGDGTVGATLTAPNLYGGKFGQSGVSGAIHFYSGRRDQAINNYWNSFPLASIPGIYYEIDASGNVTINVFFRRDIASIRWAVSTVGPPSDGDVLGGTLISAPPWRFTYSALTSGQTLFVGILGFTVGGTPSPLASFSITWSGSPQTGAPTPTGSAGSTEPAPNMPNLCYAVFEDTNIGQSALIRPLYFEVGRTPAVFGFGIDGANADGDANPIGIIYELLTDPLWGIGLTTDDFDLTGFVAASGTLAADGLFLSYLVTQQQPAQQLIDEILRTIDGVRYTDPVTGQLGVQLIRADYVVGSLPVFDPTNVEECDFTQAGWRETVNEVKVTFTDRARDYQQNQVAAQDLAGIMATGRVATSSVSYLGVTSEDLALRLAQRDLRALALPLSKARLKMNREAFDLHEGSPFLLNWPDYGVSGVVMRVMTIGRPGRDDGTITIECIQDSFSLPATPSYATSGVTWTDPVGPGAVQVPEVTPVSDRNATTGAVALQIDDPDSRITKVQFQHQSGNGAMTALATASPPYHDQVALDPRYPSTINYVVTYGTPDGSLDTIDGTVTFAVEQAPETPELTASIDAAGNVTVNASVSPDTTGMKWAASTSAFPSAATVRAATLDVTAPFQFASAGLAVGATLFVAAFAYDAAGNESPALGMVEITNAATTDAEYLLLASDATLTDARIFNPNTSTDFVETDHGPGSTFDLALKTTGVTAASYGDATHVPQITVDAKGRITAAANVGISGGGGNLTFDLVQQFGDGLNAGAVGEIRQMRVDVACTIQLADIFADQSGSAVVDIQTSSDGITFTSIAASAKPTLSSQQEHSDATLTGWTLSIPAGDYVRWVLNSISGCKLVAVALTVTAPSGAVNVGGSFGDGVSGLTSGYLSEARVPVAVTITLADIYADASGSASVDVQTSSDGITYASICGGNPPTLSSQQEHSDATLTGWTVSVPANRYVRLILLSVATCKFVGVTLKCTRV